MVRKAGLNPSAPALRVLRVEPAALGGSEGAARVGAAARRMGFAQLSLAWSPASAPAGALGGAGNDDAFIAGLAAHCREQGLGLLLDAEPAAARPGSALALQQPRWFEAPAAGDELPDPRLPPPAARILRLRAAGEPLLAELQRWWYERMAAWLQAGVAGFCCRSGEGLAAGFWQETLQALRGDRPEACFIAAPSADAARLAGCGFEALALPVPLAADEVQGYLEAHERIAAAGCAPMAWLLAPDRRAACASPSAEAQARTHRRSLWWAAASGGGLLMPLGFERGLADGTNGGSAAPAEFAEFDLADEVAAANAWLTDRQVPGATAPRLRLLGASGAPALAVLATERRAPRPADRALLLLASFAAAGIVAAADLLPGADRYTRFRRLPQPSEPEGGEADACLDAGTILALSAGSIVLYESLPPEPAEAQPTRAAAAANRARRALELALRAPRLAIEAITPSVDGGRFVVKRVAGESLRVEADVFMDGHDKLAAVLLWRAPEEGGWREVPMAPLGNDRWRAEFPLARIGRHAYTIEAWRDAWETFRDELGKKVGAGLDVALEVEEGRRLLVQAAEHAAAQQGRERAAAALQGLLERFGALPDITARIELLLADAVAQGVRAACLRPFALRHEPALCVDAERTAARYASWYELFPRSIGNRPGEPLRHGTFDDVIERLPAIRDMGFDVLYFTPIHPIGTTNRKGRNNTLTPTPDDPGSPYAIGSEEGGHDAIHRELGTLEDFLRLVRAAADHGLELALDFAIQCSPDHPWLKEHPEWFSWRPDGSMRYAENPPKKYQDIVNVDFYAEGARPQLWLALRDVVLFWVRQGVRLFRVDNPHTKPLPFWEWMIGDVRARHPEVVFLSEAFTRPKPMVRLAKVGFSQSYTYFTWRHTKQEFTDYLNELNRPPASDVLRPHFFVNTPDINPYFLQRSGRAGFLIRAALATTLSGLWGMYSGFELCEGTPLPGKEEYLDSEKYEIRAWDWQRPGHIIAEITRLNRIRRAHPALQTHLGVEFLPAWNDNVLYFAKVLPSQLERSPEGRYGDQVVLVAISLDPHHAQEADIELPLWRFGLPDDAALDAVDLLHDARFTWQGKRQHIRLDPASLPYAIWRVRPKEAR